MSCDLDDIKYRDMVSVNGGTYMQESNKNQSFRHVVSDFKIGKYEVSYGLWYTVYQWATDNGYRFANPGREGKDGSDGKSPSSSKYEPVTCVNWRDCIVWCNAYSEMCGYDPVYTDNNGNILHDSRDSNGDVCDNAHINDGNGYRLPTEGEWEFAASDRGSTPFNYASGASDDYTNDSACDRVAWYRVVWYCPNSDEKTHKVGTKSSNGLGLHDMSGNVWEWCWDWYGDSPTSATTDYRGAGSVSGRVLRGGSWVSSSYYLQVGFRYYDYPDSRSYDVGFRVAGWF